MLCQMVCIDRRYQRMNCFNIREIQTLLRSKYQPDSLTVNEQRQFLSEMVIGMRFKLGGLESIDPSMSLSFHYGLLNLPVDRDQLYYLELEHTSQNYSTYLFHVYVHKFFNFIARILYSWEYPFGRGDISLLSISLTPSSGQF
jgi:hypothetical protein